MASAEFGHVERAAATGSRELGADPFEAMAPFAGADRRLPRAHGARRLVEGLIKAYVGDGLAADFYREIAAYLDADTRDLIIDSPRGRRPVRVRRRPGPRARSRPTRGSAAGSRCGAAG